MKATRRRLGLPLAAVIAAMLSTLAFLYVKSQAVGDADHFEHVAVLRHMKEVDAQWELEVLKSRIGLNTHYDILADSLTELNGLLAQLEQQLVTHTDDAATLAQARETLLRSIREKAALIERFKSNNSVLRNSLAFLPTAADDIQLARAPSHTRASVNKLLLESMLYSQSATAARAAQIQADLRHLEAELPSLAPATRERLEIFRAHVGTILREQKLVDDLMGGISTVPTAEHINAIGNILGKEQQRNEAENRRHREYLLLFAAVALGLLLYAGLHLMRSSAMVARVNRELHGANEHLEQRVHERTQELRKTQSELVATARQAGMAEIATNVLHNVGNILNSVNVSAGVVTGTLRTSKAQGLGRAVQLMKEHESDLGDFLTRDPKGRLLREYLGTLAQTLIQEQQTMAGELEHLTRSVDHIKEVVATQQSYAVGSSVVEPVQIRDLAEDALRMNGGSLAHKVSVVKEFSDVPMARLDRGRVLQILVNLISNAKNAMADAVEGSNRLTLRIEEADARLRVSVQDQGEGISAQNLTRIFAHGFTTRKAGHGFGLHSCALAAKQMGGTLTAHSDGPGKGATFTLDLPLNAA
jgi:two-component system NtrC family sensor kinase